MHAHHFCIEFASHVLHFLKAQKKRHGAKKTTTRQKKEAEEEEVTYRHRKSKKEISIRKIEHLQ
jgi:hypothetical protein